MKKLLGLVALIMLAGCSQNVTVSPTSTTEMDRGYSGEVVVLDEIPTPSSDTSTGGGVVAMITRINSLTRKEAKDLEQWLEDNNDIISESNIITSGTLTKFSDHMIGYHGGLQSPYGVIVSQKLGDNTYIIGKSSDSSARKLRPTLSIVKSGSTSIIQAAATKTSPKSDLILSTPYKGSDKEEAIQLAASSIGGNMNDCDIINISNSDTAQPYLFSLKESQRFMTSLPTAKDGITLDEFRKLLEANPCYNGSSYYQFAWDQASSSVYGMITHNRNNTGDLQYEYLGTKGSDGVIHNRFMNF